MSTGRLHKLILMLSSDQPGEALGAASAIGRFLRDAGHDWHWLASQVEGVGAPVDLVVAQTRIRQLEAEVAEVRAELDQVQAERDAGDSWVKAAEEIFLSSRLSEAERNFVEDMRARYILNSAYQPSDKQTAWFVRIYRTHVKRAAA